MQDFLRSQGFNPGPTDGAFGPKTKAAVEQYQASRGLKADGIVGDKTKAAISQDRQLEYGLSGTGSFSSLAVGEQGATGKTVHPGTSAGTAAVQTSPNVKGVNPSRAEAVAYVTQQAEKYGVPARIALAIGMQESHLHQFNQDGSPIVNYNNDGTFDVGMFQVNSSHDKEYDLKRLATDWKYNVDAGMESSCQ